MKQVRQGNLPTTGYVILEGNEMHIVIDVLGNNEDEVTSTIPVIERKEVPRPLVSDLPELQVVVIERQVEVIPYPFVD